MAEYQLNVIVASSGSRFEVEVNPATTGQNLKQKIAEETSIVIDRQILFTQRGITIKELSLPLNHSLYNNDIFDNDDNDDLNLIDDENKLSSNEKLSLNASIFVFDKQYSQHPLISPELLLNPNNYIIDQNKLNLSSEDSLKKHKLFNANKSILFQTLLKFDIEFNHHYNLAKYIKNECYKKYTASTKCVKQINNTVYSLRGLTNHLDTLRRKLSNQYNKFLVKCDEQLIEHQLYLDDFEKDLKNLQTVELHPAIQTKSRKTMLDVVDEGRFRKWYQKALNEQKNQKQLKNDRIKRYKNISKECLNIFVIVSGDINRERVKQIKSDNFNSDTSDLIDINKEIATIKEKIGIGPLLNKIIQKNKVLLINNIESIIKIFENDINKVENIINTIVEDNDNDNKMDLKLLEMEKCCNEHNNKYISELYNINKSIMSMLHRVSKVQESMTDEFINIVGLFIKIQKLISSESKTMDAVLSALKRKNDVFCEFAKLQALPGAYKECINEITRRRMFGYLLNNEINNHLRNIFNVFRNNEKQKRKLFIKEYGMLPADLIDGLANMPGSITIRYDYKEDDLPLIDNHNNDNIIRKELQSIMNEYKQNNNDFKWKWGWDDKLVKEPVDNINQADLYKEELKWKAKIQNINVNHEKEINELQNKITKLSKVNSDLTVELEQWKNNEYPDAPHMNDLIDSSSLGVSTNLLGSKFMLYSVQSELSQHNSSNDIDHDKIMAQLEVFKDENEKLKHQLTSKTNVIQKLNLENDKLKKQSSQLTIQLDKLKESSTSLRNEMRMMIKKHTIEIENLPNKSTILKLKNDINKSSNNKNELLQMIKQLSDTIDEYDNKYNELEIKFVELSSKYNELKSSSVWINAQNKYILDNDITDNNLLFLKSASNNNGYQAILNNNDQIQKQIPIILNTGSVEDHLNQLKWPKLLIGEVIMMQRQSMIKDYNNDIKKGDQVYIVTAGSLQIVNYSFILK